MVKSASKIVCLRLFGKSQVLLARHWFNEVDSLMNVQTTSKLPPLEMLYERFRQCIHCYDVEEFERKWQDLMDIIPETFVDYLNDNWYDCRET